MEKKEHASWPDKSKLQALQAEALDVLKQLIATPSFSREEDGTATLLQQYLQSKGCTVHRQHNNVWTTNLHFEESKPTLLFNSHHDTVKPNPHYTLHPYQPIEKDGKLFGLGSNDAGGALVSLMATFFYYYKEANLPCNLVFAATAEEEISGKNGVEALIPLLPKIQAAIVGEPTLMQMAVAERGLMVLDCVAEGKAGHAAREEGVNAIYKALHDIEWIRNFQFEKQSSLLGPVKMSVTGIETDNKAHNVVPATCRFTVDVRVNEQYSLEEVLATVREHVQSTVQPRSLRLRSSSISTEHQLVQSGLSLGRECYGSPTTSDKALMPFPALKMGPGDSARSHTADEFIFVQEIYEGIELYAELLHGFFERMKDKA